MKKLLSFLLTLLMLAGLCISAGASEANAPLIVDHAGVLTADEIADLTEKADSLRYIYEMDVVILVVTDIGGSSSQDFADDYYDNNGYGVGDEYSGMLLMIATESRDWWISTCGEGIYVLTDYGIESIFSEFSGYLAVNDYYGAFTTYLDCLPEYFDAYYNGDPIDGISGGYNGPGTYAPGDADDIVYYDEEITFGLFELGFCLLIGCAVSGIVVLIMSACMNTRRPQHSAKDYLNTNSYHLYENTDMFLYSNVSKVRKQESSGSGGSSVHSSSSGRSHGGGGGKF